jgi:WD40 repeat protein/DNA-binding SARP family transcriptional activator
MSVSVLGPVAVDGDESLAPRDRVVLAALAMSPREAVSADRLADALWGETPPATWPKVVQGSVVRIRKALGADAVRTTERGYVLAVPDDDIDAVQFQRLVRRGQELLDLGEPDRAQFALTTALGLWHGEALPELEGWEPGATAARRLAEMRRDAEELRVEAILQAGGWREVLPEAGALVSEQPLRERRWGLLAQAQYQAGRQGEALATLQRARAVLVAELGLDPGPELAALEQAILRQDPSLTPHTDRAAVSPLCPYRGLLPYDLDDTEDYFGRDRDVAVCRAILDEHRILAVVGPSGSGKSSLVRAGVAAGLRRDGRAVAVMTPGAHPMAALLDAAALRTLTVLVVDQAEEVVTVCRDAEERDAFLDALVGHVEAGAAVVVAVRADHLGFATAHRAFSRLVEQGLYLLGAMNEDDLRSAIEGPARRAGLLLEPGLVDLLVEEVSGEPGALPLMSHALARTWEAREGRTLTVAGYREAGGIRGAVTQSAEALFQSLPADQQLALRDLLLRLVAVGQDGHGVRSPVARRVVTGDGTLESLVELLTAARLVTSDGDVVELAHESLVGAWPRLRSWLDEDVEGQSILRHLTVAADSWEAMGRPASELYRGTRLARALDWREHATAELAPVEQAFLEAGRELAEVESRSAERRLQEQRQANRRLRLVLGGMAVVVVTALVAGFLALREGRRADVAALGAQVRELAAASRAATAADPELGILLALEAVTLSEGGADTAARDSVEALHSAIVGSRVDLVVPGLGGSVAWSPDGAVFVTEGPEGSGVVDLRDAATGASVRSFTGHDVDVNNVTFSPDGLLATTGDDGYLRVWDPEDARLVSEVGGDGQTWGPSFSPDSGRVAAAWPDEGVVRVVDVATGNTVMEAERLVDGPLWTSFSQDGQSLAVATDGPSRARVLDAATGRLRVSLGGQEDVGTVRYSPDGRWLATADPNGALHVRDSRTGRTAHVLSDGSGGVAGVAWARDSGRLAAGGFDGTTRVYDLSDTQAELAFALPGGLTAVAWELAFSPDGTRLIAGDPDVTAATVWDLGPLGDAEVVNVPGAPGVGSDVVFTDDSHLATTTRTGAVTVWDTTDASAVARFKPPETRWAGDIPTTLAAGPDGSLLAAGRGEWTQVLDLDNGRELFATPVGIGVWRSAISPDSTLLALANEGRTLSLSRRDGSSVARLAVERDHGLFAPAFSPDGGTVATVKAGNGDTIDDVGVVLWDWQSDTTVEWPDAHGDRPAWSPDGRQLVLVRPAGADVWDVESGEQVLTLRGHAAGITHAVFNPDGSTVATAGFDGTVRLWDARTGDPVLRLPAQPGEVSSVAFSPDGRYLATSPSADGVARVWALDTDELVSIAREKTTRALTDAECREYLHRDECA